MSSEIIIDKAGATSGGARRYLLELMDYLERAHRLDIKLIGGERLSPGWLLEREFKAQGADRIALNNASFALPGGERTVLLRNALHFASSEEFRNLSYVPSKHMRRQIPVIRLLAHRADTIIVPCTAMAERVVKVAPKLQNRIQVMLHPVSPRGWEGTQPDPEKRIILVPVVPQTYKRLDQHIPAILRAAKDTGALIAVTAFRGEIPEADGHPQYLPIGRMPAEELASWWARATAIYFPPAIESFGYALAEARCGGRPVIAPNTPQNQEIAGPALIAYDRRKKLADAVYEALESSFQPEPEPFDPDSYFGTLLGDVRGKPADL